MVDKRTFQQVLGQNLRRIRLSKNLTVERLALEAGLSYSQVSRIELGKINTSAYTIHILSAALKVSVSEFYHDC
jgi:transcriptional regulator with XRE-family HTH domain